MTHSIIQFLKGKPKSLIVTNDADKAKKKFDECVEGVVRWYRLTASGGVILARADHEASAAQAAKLKAQVLAEQAAEEIEADVKREAAADALAKAYAYASDAGVDLTDYTGTITLAPDDAPESGQDGDAPESDQADAPALDLTAEADAG